MRSRPSGGRYCIETRFTRALRDLSARFEYRLFLSATPHDGYSNSFSTLLELLEPYRCTRGVKIAGKRDHVLLYTLSADQARAEIVEGLLREGHVISAQVLNECASAARNG